MSGDNVMELGALIESVTRWVGHPTWVVAMEGLVDPRLPDDPQHRSADVPDHIRVLAALPSEASLSMVVTPLAPPAVLGRRVVLSGSEGVLEVDLAGRRLVLHRPTGSDEVRPREDEPRDWSVEADFCAAVREIGCSDADPSRNCRAVLGGDELRPQGCADRRRRQGPGPPGKERGAESQERSIAP